MTRCDDCEHDYPDDHMAQSPLGGPIRCPNCMVQYWEEADRWPTEEELLWKSFVVEKITQAQAQP